MAYNAYAYVKVSTSLQRVNFSTHWSMVDGRPDNFPATPHDHDNRYNTKSEITTLLSSKEPSIAKTEDGLLRILYGGFIIDTANYLTSVTSHASTGTTYGAGTTTNYGHVKLGATGGAATYEHTHSSYNRASTTLSGASVFSNIVVSNGIVTSISTRSLTAANVGAVSTSGTAYNSTRFGGKQLRVGSYTSGASGYITLGY